ncbi:MAG: peptidylprolyl isomerase [Kiritimatiellia bacterium]
MKILSAIAVAALVSLSHGATLDTLAAKVNSQVITVSDVLHEMRRDNPKIGVQGPEFKLAYSNALEKLIDRRLILKQAVDKKMDVQEWMVDNRVREIVKDVFAGDRNKLNAALAESKIPITEWRNAIRDDMVVSGMRYQMVEKNVVATPAAMLAEYRDHLERYSSDAKTTVSVILLRPAGPGDGNAKSLEARAQEILGQLDRKADFAELARKHSADSHAADGGVWKDVDPNDAFRPEIAETIAKLKVGQHSRLVNLDGWGFIVRKDAESAARQKSFAEAYDDIERNVKDELARQAHQAWVKRLRAAAFVKIYPMPDAQ